MADPKIPGMRFSEEYMAKNNNCLILKISGVDCGIHKPSIFLNPTDFDIFETEKKIRGDNIQRVILDVGEQDAHKMRMLQCALQKMTNEKLGHYDGVTIKRGHYDVEVPIGWRNNYNGTIIHATLFLLTCSITDVS